MLHRITRITLLPLIMLVSCLGAIAQGKSGTTTTPAQETSSLSQNQPIRARVLEGYGKLPLTFEVNQGQTDPQVKFLSRGSGYTLFLTGNEAVLALRKGKTNDTNSARTIRHTEQDFASIARRGSQTTKAEKETLEVLKMELVGANPSPMVLGLEELSGKSNYLIGNDPKKWRTNVPNYGKVKYEGVYPGVDLVYYGNQGQFEYDFVVAPGADPKAIQLSLVEEGSAVQRAAGGRPYQIDTKGDLVIRLDANDAGEVRFHKPVVYQEQLTVNDSQSTGQNGNQAAGLLRNPSPKTRTPRTFLDGRYMLNDNGDVAFDVASYDHSKPLVIDPVLSYSTFLGGSGADVGTAIAVDSSGSAYVTGYANSADFPTSSAIQSGNAGNYEVFICKLNPAGSALVYSTYLGGSNFDLGAAIAVDISGNAYVTGETYSTNFPTANALQASFGGGTYDAFVVKLNAAGSALLYSTYLGGGGNDVGRGIAVDTAGNTYVTGATTSTNFPTANPLQATYGGIAIQGGDAFVSKLDSAGSALVYSTYLGGSNADYGTAIAVDSSGNAYVTGDTGSGDFPTTPDPIQAAPGCCNYTSFVSKLNAPGSALVYSTYLGGGGENALGIAVDSSRNAYVTGLTNSPVFPTTANALQPVEAGSYDAYVAKLNPAGSALVYSTYLGGSDKEHAFAIAVDSSGNAYVTGLTQSTDFPTVNPLQATYAGNIDAYVAKLNPAGSALVYSTYLGGSGSELGQGIAVDTAGNAYVMGFTNSTDFPTASPLQAGYAGSGDAFVAKLGPGYAAQIQQPINPDGTSVFSVKRGVVPVKFTLSLNGVATCSLPPATISLIRTAGTVLGSIDESVYLQASDSGSNFRIDSCQYVYNLGTSSLGIGTYRVNISVGGSVVGSGAFGLK